MPVKSVTSTAVVTDEDNGEFITNTSGLEMKSRGGKSIVEGYLTTKAVDNDGDVFTEDALEDIADQLQASAQSVDVHFPDVSEDTLKAHSNGNTGNLDHQNFPGYPFANTRVVPAFKIVEAKYDGYGVLVKAVLNSDGLLPDVADAVKNSIMDGYLDAFSIEFGVPKGGAEVIKTDDGMIRRISKANVMGAAMTGRPVNPTSKFTDMSLKSMIAKGAESQLEDEDDINTGDSMPEEEAIEDEGATSEGQEGTDDGEAKAETQETEGAEEQTSEAESLTKSDIEGLKSEIQGVVEDNKSLKEENEELRDQLEDYKAMEGMKSEIEALRDELDDLAPQDEPLAKSEEDRQVEPDAETKSQLERVLDNVGSEGSREREEFVEAKANFLAEKYDKTVEEVKQYA